MVEFMMALTIGLFIVAGILEIYMSTLQMYRIQDETSQLQDNGRFGIEILNRYARMAGYRTDPSTSYDTAFSADSRTDGDFNYSFRVSQVVDGADGNKNTFDNITLRYQGGPNKTVGDCLGNPVVNERMVVITFYVSQETLRCRSTIKRQALNTFTVESESTADLIVGVENMEIRYGIDTDFAANSHEAVKAYVDATTLKANTLVGQSTTPWQSVVSVQIALLLRTESSGVLPDTQTYYYPPWSDTPTTAGDYRLRRVFTTNINLRNLTP